MTIKEVEKLVGMTSANIRFYEKEGLIHPSRNNSNNYRDYSKRDVENLKKIKILRVLGISIQEIHEIIDGEKELYDSMNERLGELREEAKKIEEVEKTCQYIMVHHMDYDSMDSNVLDEKAASVKNVIEDVLTADIVEETITGRQLNRTIGVMTVYGLLVSGIISLLFGDFFRQESFAWLFITWCIVSFIAGIVVDWTAKVSVQMVVFHGLVLMLSPALNILIEVYLKDYCVGITKDRIAFVMFLLAILIMIITIVGEKYEKLYRKYGKIILLTTGYSIVASGVLYFAVKDLKVFIILAGVMFIADFSISIFWVDANLAYRSYNRYHAIVSAIYMINIVFAILNLVGRNHSSGVGRWRNVDEPEHQKEEADCKE